MYETFSERARKVMALAGEAARQMQHEYLGTEHVLLAIIKEGSCKAIEVLHSLAVDTDRISQEVDKLIKQGPDPVSKGKLPGTPRMKEAIRTAISEARTLKQDHVGTEHLLLGLMSQEDGVAAQVLMNLAVTPDTLRQAVMKLLGVKTDSGQKARIMAPDQSADYVKQLLTEAVEKRASDVHIAPTADGRGRIRLRIDGVLYDSDPPAEGTYEQLVSQVKTMAGMDVSEQVVPQDGRYLLDMPGGKLDGRVNVIPTIHGQRIAMRLLQQDRGTVVLGLNNIGLLEDDLAALRAMCALPCGIILVNGPTGCGKTTTLYSMLMERNRETSAIFTIEDPVEYDIDGVDQLLVQPQKGLTFARAMRNMLRQDPDVIMVGEIRDAEVMQLCAQCAVTGHLVFTTLHANDSPRAFERIVNLGVPSWLVCDAVVGIVSQRLVRALCEECKEPVEPSLHLMPRQAAEFIRNLQEATFYTPKGCPTCAGTGYRGRTGIYEILAVDDALRELLSTSPTVAALREKTIAGGMKTLLINGMEKAARGITSIREVLRVAPSVMADQA